METTNSNSHPYSYLEQPDTNNATWFNPKEKANGEYWDGSDEWGSKAAFRFWKKREWWEYQAELNDGIRNGKRTNGPYFTYRDNRDLIENVGQQIDLSERQVERVKRYFWFLHRKRIKRGRKDQLVVAIAMYVVHTDEQDTRRWYPRIKVDDETLIRDVFADQFALSPKLLERAYRRVQRHLQDQDPADESPEFDIRNMDRRGYVDDDERFLSDGEWGMGWYIN